MAALNSQTAMQFQQYAAQQYPGNYEQQQILIRQLQEQHYQQYMQQLYQVQLAQQQVWLTDRLRNLDFVSQAVFGRCEFVCPYPLENLIATRRDSVLVTNAASDSNTKTPLFNIFK